MRETQRRTVAPVPIAPHASHPAPRHPHIFPHNPPMPSSDLFQLVQIAYWLALATWFGGVLFIAMAAPVIFRTVRENDPTLPMVLAVNLEGQHSSVRAGTIVSNLIAQLIRVELACAGGLAIALAAQWFVTDVAGERYVLPLL